ncbi:MAG TPA: zf-HC2 domain-containing protein [Oculatellaceae cyanobacterium]
MNANSQKCEKFIPLLDAYHDGELTESEKNSVDEHLRECSACSAQLAGVSRLVATLKTIPSLQMRDDFADKFEARLLQEKPAVTLAKSNVISRRFALAVASAAAFVLCVCAGQLLFRPGAAPNEVAAVPQPPVNQVSKTLQAEELAAVPSRDTRAPGVNSGVRDGEEDSARKVTPNEKPVVPVDSMRRRGILAGARTVVASETAGRVDQPIASDANSAAPKHSLVALYEPEANSIPEELGISTDEDGLYAIKM